MLPLSYEIFNNFEFSINFIRFHFSFRVSINVTYYVPDEYEQYEYDSQ